MGFQPSEIADFLMMLVLGPITLVVARRTAPVTVGPVAVCLGLMFSGYTATILEGMFLPVFLNRVEHGAYAAAGLAFIWLLTRIGGVLRTSETGR